MRNYDIPNLKCPACGGKLQLQSSISRPDWLALDILLDFLTYKINYLSEDRVILCKACHLRVEIIKPIIYSIFFMIVAALVIVVGPIALLLLFIDKDPARALLTACWLLSLTAVAAWYYFIDPKLTKVTPLKS